MKSVIASAMSHKEDTWFRLHCQPVPEAGR